MAAFTFNIDDATLGEFAAAAARLKAAEQRIKDNRMAEIQQWIDGNLVPAICAAWGTGNPKPPKSITVYLDGVTTWEEVQKIQECWNAKKIEHIWIEPGDQLADCRKFTVHLASR